MEFDPLGYYKILEVEYNTDEKSLKFNYRNKVKLWHPDHNKAENALEVFQKISLAYDVLSNPKSKTIYDLLALVYTAQDFPDMKTFKLYKAVDGNETPFLRVFSLQKISGSFLKSTMSEEKLIGTFADAQKFIGDTAKQNWIKGFLFCKIGAFSAIKNNIKNINKNANDNLKMLVHNAAVFYEAEKADKAVLSARQALEYAPADIKSRLLDFINRLPPVNTPILQWDYAKLKKIQLKIPAIIAAFFVVLCLVAVYPLMFKLLANTSSDDKIAYYQEVRFNTGGETVDDMVMSKVFNIPVDSSDETMLFHITSAANIMYGPSEQFDIMEKAVKNQTVRVTGYTPDQEWYRVMLDNGEMGFIKKSYLKQGIGLAIPEGSKVFEATEETR